MRSPTLRGPIFNLEKGAEMVLEELPENVVETLKKHHKALDKHLGMLENIDHRKQWANGRWNGYAARVRQLDVSSRFPEIKKVVIKRLHDYTPAETKEIIRKKIENYEAYFHSDNGIAERREYDKEPKAVLLMPKAYPIGGMLVAMSKTDAPNAEEVDIGRNPREREYRNMLRKKHGITGEQYRNAILQVARIAGIGSVNMLVAGAEKGKVVLVPLFDSY